MTNFLNTANFRDSRLDGAIDATQTTLRVEAGTNQVIVPEIPNVLTLTSGTSLIALQGSERVKVLGKTLGDEDELHVIRNFDNPTDNIVVGALDGDHNLGETTLNVTGFVTLVDGNQVNIEGHEQDYALVSHTGATITIYPGLEDDTSSGADISIRVPTASEAQAHANGKPIYLFECAAYWNEVHDAINALELNPYPDDLTGDTLTLVNHLQVGSLKGGFPETAGMIRWEGGHFQGYTGVDWANLDEGSGGGWTPPVGTDGAILVWDTDDWYASTIWTLTASQAQLTLGVETWTFTEAGAIFTTPLQAKSLQIDYDIWGDTIEANYAAARVGSFIGLDTRMVRSGYQVLVGYDDGSLTSSTQGLIAAVEDFDLTDSIDTFLTDLIIMSDNFTAYSNDDMLYMSLTNILFWAPLLTLGAAAEITDDYVKMIAPSWHEPMSGYPVSPENGMMIYHDTDGFQIYQAGGWHAIAYGSGSGIPIPGLPWALLRYSPDLGDWEPTDLLSLPDDGAYFTCAIKIGERLPAMTEAAGLIEFRNNDFLGYVEDPDGYLIEVSLTNMSTSQRFPVGVESGRVNGTYGTSETIIHLTGLTNTVTDGEYIQFDGDNTNYTILTHVPTSGPTITITISPGLIAPLADGTYCSTRAYRTLYYGDDNVWHSTDILRIHETEQLARTKQMQIGSEGVNGYEGTIRWEDATKQFQWHNGTDWQYWPISGSVPEPTSAGGLLVSIESAPSVFIWAFDTDLVKGETTWTSTLDFTVPGLIITDGLETVELRPGDFTFPAITTPEATIDVLSVVGEDSYATIDTLFVKNLTVAGESGVPSTLSGPRLDLLSNDTNAYTFTLIPTADTIAFNINVQLSGAVSGEYVAGAKVITVTAFTGEVQNGNRIRFADDPNTYVIQAHVGNPTTQITLAHPGLYQDLHDTTLCYTDDLTFTNVFEVTMTDFTFTLDVIAPNLNVTRQLVCDYTITIGDEEPLISETAGMVRFNGDFQGCLEPGVWVSFTRSLAEGDYATGYGTLLWWNGSQWQKNVNLQANSTGVIVLGTDLLTPGVAGALRWTGVDFQGHNGATWTSLTGYGGAPALPSGAGYPGATLYWDDDTSQWRVNENLTSNGVKTTAALLQIGDYGRFAQTGYINHGGGYGIGATILAVDGFIGTVVDGTIILVAGDATPHVVSAHDPEYGPTTTVTIEAPGLAAVVADDAEITVADALPTQVADGGQVRYNQNDYEGFIAGVGWASFTGHRSWLPTLEGDPTLEVGNPLVFNGTVWIGRHELTFTPNLATFTTHTFFTKDIEVLGTTQAMGGICLGDHLPMGLIDASESSGSVIDDDSWPEGQTYYEIGDTRIKVDQSTWTGEIGIGTTIQIGLGATVYTVTGLTPAMGVPIFIEFTPGLATEVYSGDNVDVEGTYTAVLGAPGTIYFDLANQAFWGYDGSTWRNLISPIQGTPSEDQVLRYVPETGYWEPAALGTLSLLLLHDDEAVSAKPVRILDSNSDGWRLESAFDVEGLLERYAFLVRGLSYPEGGTKDIFSAHPLWGYQDIWLECSLGDDEQAGPFFRSNATYNIFNAISSGALTVRSGQPTTLGGVLLVVGSTTMNQQLTITSGDLLLESGDLFVLDGFIEAFGDIRGKALLSHSYGYFETYARVGYVEDLAPNIPIGAIRYSTPGNIGEGDWEGWDGTEWVSFTGSSRASTIYGTPTNGDTVAYNSLTGHWEVQTNFEIFATTLELNVTTNVNADLNVIGVMSVDPTGNAYAYTMIGSYSVAADYTFIYCPQVTTTGAHPLKGIRFDSLISDSTCYGIDLDSIYSTAGYAKGIVLGVVQSDTSESAGFELGSVSAATSAYGLKLGYITATNNDAYGIYIDSHITAPHGTVYALYAQNGSIYLGTGTVTTPEIYTPIVHSNGSSLTLETTARANAITISTSSIITSAYSGGSVGPIYGYKIGNITSTYSGVDSIEIYGNNTGTISCAQNGAGNYTIYGMNVGAITKVTSGGGASSWAVGLNVGQLTVDGPSSQSVKGINVAGVVATHGTAYGLYIGATTGVAANYAIWSDSTGESRLNGTLTLATGSFKCPAGQGLYVNALKVVGDQAAAIADLAPGASLSDVINKVNAIISMLEGHGLIATTP